MTAERTQAGDPKAVDALLVAGPRWFLVHTKPLSEQVAATHLARQGFETYLPRLKHRVLKGARWAERVVALFPRYVFIRLDVLTQALAPVRSTRGVSGVVRFGEEAAVVPDGVIDGLFRRADSETGLHHLSSARPLRGAAVSVTGGPLAGLDGIFERDLGEDRAIIVGSSRVDLQACKLEYSIVSPK